MNVRSFLIANTLGYETHDSECNASFSTIDEQFAALDLQTDTLGLS